MNTRKLQPSQTFCIAEKAYVHLRVIYTDVCVCVARARGKYLLGIMWPAEQAEVSARPIHHMQKTADTASTPWFPNTLQQRGGPLQNPNHRYPTVSPQDLGPTAWLSED